MKFRILLTGILVVVLSGCENFLNVNPETAVTPNNFFETQSDFEQAVNGAYAPLQLVYDTRDVFGTGGDWMLAEMRSDNTHFTFNVDNRGAVTSENIATFLVEANNLIVADKYNNNYQIISRANEVLAQIDQADFDQSAKDRLKGETLYLRALAYFDLVKNFGGVPLHLEPAGSLEETSLARSSASDVYDQIITDATSAADLLPSKDNQQTGRATAGAAYTLLGDVYLTVEQWSDAESALTNVTSYSLLPDYANVFDPANEGNDEMIFEVEFLAGTSQTLFSVFPYHFLPRLNDPSVITGVSPAQLNEGGWNTPTPDLIAAYEDTVQDERYAASIGRYTGPSPITGFTYDDTPYIKKYQHDHPSFGQTEQNWPVYRYAEVLLMMAEAINEQGGRLDEAEGYLNDVRNRAGLNDYTASGQADLRDAIYQERRIELAFENKRWHDLVRTGRAVDVMNSFGESVKANPQNYYYAPGNAPTGASFNVTENKLIYPIPFREINLNPDLEQNPGY